MIKHSQNFINNNDIINECFRYVSIPEGGVVIEIGGGKGIITEKLVELFKNIIVVEFDKNLFEVLKKKFMSFSHVQIENTDFLTYPLPKEEFNIIANIPFNITSDIIRKITGEGSDMQHAYLIMQKSAALKFVPEYPGVGTSLLSNLIQIRYSIQYLLTIDRKNFSPQPKHDASLIHFRSKNKSVFLDKKQEELFRDFLCFMFTRSRPFIADAMSALFSRKIVNQILQKSKIKTSSRIKTLQFEEWLLLFRNIDFVSNKKILLVIKGKHKKLINEQRKLQKIHRTRRY